MSGADNPPAGALQQQDGLAERLRAALGAITIEDDSQRPKQNYAFWGTQPVAQFNEQPSTSVRACWKSGREGAGGDGRSGAATCALLCHPKLLPCITGQ